MGNLSSPEILQPFYNSLRLPDKLKPIVGFPLAKVMALDIFEQWYKKSLSAPGESFPEKVLNTLNITLIVIKSDIDKIPLTGPCVIVANHPFGGLDGIILAALLIKIRPDFRLLANNFISLIPEMKEYCIYVKPSQKQKSFNANYSPVKEAIHHVRQGGLLVLFPAGVVSHYQLSKCKVTDPEWQITMGRLIKKSKAPVIPAFISGENTILFQLLGLIHPALRTMRLPSEMINKRDLNIKLRFGTPVKYSTIDKIDKAESLIKFLHTKTYALQNEKTLRSANISASLRPPVKLTQSLHYRAFNLHSDQILLEDNDTLVFYRNGDKQDDLMKLIGLERERAFRLVGEGSGKEIDIDEFDEYYLQLIAWSKKDNRLIGAYRMGVTDKIIEMKGKKGLYINTLFNIHPCFFAEIYPAIELGRSFICPEYQRSYQPLMLLWKGIGLFITRNRQYRYLYGAVSISNDYLQSSQNLMVKFIKVNHWNIDLATMVSPKNPFIPSKDMHILSSRIDELDHQISEIEGKPIGTPILIRQYLKLGGEFIAFNRDKDFSNALDGLIVIDLLNTPERLLQKYMGNAGLAEYYHYHQKIYTKSNITLKCFN
ncbi:MAG: lysophospholipid acyltransferase family protein [Calditrichaceae bacterium]|nr:lysophospholipid acyltransferase family protein [Calditrichaceae bacterium]MBN2708923.1 lysophospholipid acyltransferase family protein [Calditrichaceae bacterium]RQV97553.1 MAG: lysophospholipid acyltransferase family protein [Calditrichota bacterium]